MSPPGHVNFDALDAYLDQHDPGVKALSKSFDGLVKILDKMEDAARFCTCWSNVKPYSVGRQSTYLEICMGIGQGDGNTISEMINSPAGAHEILEKMAQTAFACKCDKALTGKFWPFERTEIFDPRYVHNEHPHSKILWKPLSFPRNYKDLPNDDWKHDESAPNLRADTIPDAWCWKNIFGQDSSIQPGMAPLDVLEQAFRIDPDPAKIPIIVALDVEQSLTTFMWRGDRDMIAKIPTQVGISHFDPLDAMEPSNKTKNQYNKMFPKNRVPSRIAPGDRGFIWRGCGLFNTQLYYLQVEAQYYATEGKIPGWAKSKALYPDAGSFTFHDAKGIQMKRMRPEIANHLGSLQHRKTKPGQIRPLMFVTWNYRMEMGAFRFLGLWDYLPGGKYSQQGMIRWWDLQQHWAILNKTAIIQRPGETRKLENFIAHDLKIYTEEDMKRWAHNAGMDAASTLEGFIAIFTIPKACFGPLGTRPEGGMNGWARFGTDYQLRPQKRHLDHEAALRNISSYDALWKGSENMFTYTNPVPIQERRG